MGFFCYLNMIEFKITVKSRVNSDIELDPIP